MPSHEAPPTGVSWESRATTLWKFGFHSLDVIAERHQAWHAVLQCERPDVVVLQAAPFAQIAAHEGGYSSVEFGIGFDVPPRISPFPAFRDLEGFSSANALRVESDIVQRVTQSIGSGIAKDRALCELVSGRVRIVTSIPELDHYRDEADESRRFIGPLPMAPLNVQSHRWGSATPRILAYLRAGVVDIEAFIHAVATFNGDAVVVCTGADAFTVALARSRGVRLFTSPIAIADLLSQADLVVSHGGGLIAEAVVRGKPCVAMPSHYEQFMTATALHRQKLGVRLNPKEPARYGDAMRYVLASKEVQRETAALARRCEAVVPGAGARFVQAVSSLIGES